MPTLGVGPQTAAVASVPASASTTTLFPAAGTANGRTVYNDSTAVLYIKFGATASATSYTVQLAGGAYYEFPAPVYCGQVDGIWVSATGAARITSW